MPGPIYSLKAKLWLYQSKGGWHFVTIPAKQATQIKADYIWPRHGFGSIPVNVTIGKTTWKTSIFPDKQGVYFLPIKKAVRVQEDLNTDDTMSVSIEVIN